MGGQEALVAMCRALPPDLPAAVLIVSHTVPYGRPLLARILDRAGPLPATHPADGEPVRPGHVYVAPPDRHLLLVDDVLRLSRGPHENNTRPAVDPLLRSVAVARGPRAIGVVLTGLLNDGASGLRAVKRCGGIAVVQDPEDAAYPDMPKAALAAVGADRVDYRLTLANLGATLGRLVREPTGPAVPVPDDLRAEVALSEGVVNERTQGYQSGPAVPLACPECHGTLWLVEGGAGGDATRSREAGGEAAGERGEGDPASNGDESREEHGDELGEAVVDGELMRFRCRVGHGFTAEALLASQDEALDAALWAAVRAMRERAELLVRLAEKTGGRGWSANRYRERAAESAAHSEALRRLLFRVDDPGPG
ncbi:Chemotaxis response regulator protein-glutamate methylesterase [Alienimonas californiensis]|uniref:protein-glutamate methylesterase n=2 Tax=Alienimonas californiensis TaxID=2527989 RepID=A0A517P615_9PLAN|nr:Chemotaxis response regulator protein-glutamate methylesterase [Alienimonas californiensis]